MEALKKEEIFYIELFNMHNYMLQCNCDRRYSDLHFEIFYDGFFDQTLLHLAADNGEVEALEILLQNGANIHEEDVSTLISKYEVKNEPEEVSIEETICSSSHLLKYLPTGLCKFFLSPFLQDFI
jgi:hypothetical protein